MSVSATRYLVLCFVTALSLSCSSSNSSNIQQSEALEKAQKDLDAIRIEWDREQLFSKSSVTFDSPSIELKTVKADEVTAVKRAYRQPASLQKGLFGIGGSNESPSRLTYVIAYKVTTGLHLKGDLEIYLDARDGNFICSTYPLSY